MEIIQKIYWWLITDYSKDNGNNGNVNDKRRKLIAKGIIVTEIAMIMK